MSINPQLNELLEAVKAEDPQARVGHLPKEQPTGSLAEMWLSTLQASGLTLADAALGELRWVGGRD